LILGKIYRQTDATPVINSVWKTETAWERMRGLLGRKKLKDQEGLLIVPCSSVHTIGMRYAIDVVYLDTIGKVLKTVSRLKPWRFSLCSGARYTLELPPGFLEQYPLEKGETLEWQG
jgi:uncharacterized membrane protein (UPF0127 family)